MSITDILITPASGSILHTATGAPSAITLSWDNSTGTLVWDGSAGSLFSIEDSLTGSLLSVSDISGLPIFEVFDTDRIIMGTFGNNTLVVDASRVAINKEYATEELDVSGNLAISGTTSIIGETNITDRLILNNAAYDDGSGKQYIVMPTFSVIGNSSNSMIQWGSSYNLAVRANTSVALITNYANDSAYAIVGSARKWTFQNYGLSNTWTYPDTDAYEGYEIKSVVDISAQLTGHTTDPTWTGIDFDLTKLGRTSTGDAYFLKFKTDNTEVFRVDTTGIISKSTAQTSFLNLAFTGELRFGGTGVIQSNAGLLDFKIGNPSYSVNFYYQSVKKHSLNRYGWINNTFVDNEEDASRAYINSTIDISAQLTGHTIDPTYTGILLNLTTIGRTSTGEANHIKLITDGSTIFSIDTSGNISSNGDVSIGSNLYISGDRISYKGNTAAIYMENKQRYLLANQHTFFDINGNVNLMLNYNANAVNYLQFFNSSSAPYISTLGADTDIDIGFLPKGVGTLTVPALYENRINSDNDLINKKWVDDQGFNSNGIIKFEDPSINQFAVWADIDGSTLKGSKLFQSSDYFIQYNNTIGGARIYISAGPDPGNSDAILQLRVSGAGAGNEGDPDSFPFVRWSANGTYTYSLGIDILTTDIVFNYAGDAYAEPSTNGMLFRSSSEGLFTFNDNVGGGSLTEFLRADGQWIAPPTSSGISGTGTLNQIAYFAGDTSIQSNSGFTYDGNLIIIDNDVSILSGSLTINPGNDTTVTLGNMLFNYPTSGYAHMGHYNQTSTLEWGIRFSNTRATTINSGLGQSTGLSIAGFIQWKLLSGGDFVDNIGDNKFYVGGDASFGSRVYLDQLPTIGSATDASILIRNNDGEVQIINASEIIAGSGTVQKTGAPVNEELAFWTDSSTITSNSLFNVSVATGLLTATRFSAALSSRRVKYENWGAGNQYGMGAGLGYTYGGLTDFAQTMQTEVVTGYGFWWGTGTDTDAQGSMALTHEGDLTVANSMRLGYGKSDTVTPGSIYALDVSGLSFFNNDVSIDGSINIAGTIYVADPSGPALLNIPGTSLLNPTILPNRGLPTTGIKVHNSGAIEYFMVIIEGLMELSMQNGAASFTSDLTVGTNAKMESSVTSTSNVDYGFNGDQNTGLLHNSNDNISLIAGGTDVINMSDSSITFFTDIIVGTSTGIQAIQFGSTPSDPSYGIKLFTDASGSIIFSGNSGSLFSINDSLSGSLLAISDISGLPIFEVFDTDIIIMGAYSKNTLVVDSSRVGIGTSSPIEILDISGNIRLTGDASFGGKLVVAPGSSNGVMFGDGDTGIRQDADDNLNIIINSGISWEFSSTSFRSLTTGAPYLQHTGVHYAFSGDTNSGLQQNSADNISLVTSAIEAININDSQDVSMASNLYVTGDVSVNGFYYGDGSKIINLPASADTSIGPTGVYIYINSTGTKATATGSDAISIGEGATSSALSSIAIGPQANINSADSYSISIGQSATSKASDAIAIGRLADASAAGGIAIGTRAFIDIAGGIAIGQDSDAGNGASVAIGINTAAGGASTVAIGPNAEAAASYSTTIGAGAGGHGSGSVDIGYYAGSGISSGSLYHIAIGYKAAGTYDAGVDTISIGQYAAGTGIGAISIGASTGQTTGTKNDYAISIGYSANKDIIYSDIGQDSIAIGRETESYGTDSIAIGRSAKSNTSSVAIGAAATTSGIDSVAIGLSAGTSQNYGISIGQNSYASGVGGIGIGRYMRSAAQGAIIMGYHTSAQTNALTDSFMLAWDDVSVLTVGKGIGMVLQGATGDDKGSGTLNATGVYVNGVAVGTGSGDVTKVNTPLNNEIAVWTGDGTIEGESELTYNAGTYLHASTTSTVQHDIRTTNSGSHASLYLSARGGGSGDTYISFVTNTSATGAYALGVDQDQSKAFKLVYRDAVTSTTPSDGSATQIFEISTNGDISIAYNLYVTGDVSAASFYSDGSTSLADIDSSIFYIDRSKGIGLQSCTSLTTGTIELIGERGVLFEGYSIGGHASFVANTNYIGLRDDTNNEYIIYGNRNGPTTITYNGFTSIKTNINSGVDIFGDSSITGSLSALTYYGDGSNLTGIGGGEDYVDINSIGKLPVANGIESIVIGTGDASGANSITIGKDACTNADGAIALGYQSNLTSGVLGTDSISIGANSNQGTDDIGQYSVAIGKNTQTSKYSTIAIGYQAGNTTGTKNIYSISIGYNANQGTAVIGNSSVALGANSESSSTNSIAIGNAKSNGYAAIAIGSNTATATNQHSIILGYYTGATGDGGIAIGRSSRISAQGSIMMGYHTNIQTNSLANSFELSWDGIRGFKSGLTIGTQITNNSDPATNLTDASTGSLAFDTTDNELQIFDATSTWNVVGGSQTPWTSNIDAAGYNLTGVDNIDASSYTTDGDASIGGDVYTQALFITDSNGVPKFKIVYNETEDTLDTIKL